MVDAVHPRGLSDVPGGLPARVSLPSGDVAVREDGTLTGVTENDVRALAAAYDCAPDDLRTTETCDVVKSDGEVCGRELPCPYHSDDE